LKKLEAITKWLSLFYFGHFANERYDMKIQFRIIILGFLLLGFMNCQQDKRYTFAEIETEIQPYLDLGNENTFWKSDSLVIYDSTFFNHAIATLSKYENHLEIGDSINNQLITNQLKRVGVDKIQTKNPNLYIPTNQILSFYNDKQPDKTSKIIKMEAWILGLPTQFTVAKYQLQQPNQTQTKVAIQQLEKLYFFINKEMKTISNKDFESSTLAIKDYLAFLQSKLNNGEVE
jgi:hypothetical protein